MPMHRYPLLDRPNLPDYYAHRSNRPKLNQPLQLLALLVGVVLSILLMSERFGNTADATYSLVILISALLVPVYGLLAIRELGVSVVRLSQLALILTLGALIMTQYGNSTWIFVAILAHAVWALVLPRDWFSSRWPGAALSLWGGFCLGILIAAFG